MTLLRLILFTVLISVRSSHNGNNQHALPPPVPSKCKVDNNVDPKCKGGNHNTSCTDGFWKLWEDKNNCDPSDEDCPFTCRSNASVPSKCQVNGQPNATCQGDEHKTGCFDGYFKIIQYDTCSPGSGPSICKFYCKPFNDNNNNNNNNNQNQHNDRENCSECMDECEECSDQNCPDCNNCNYCHTCQLNGPDDDKWDCCHWTKDRAIGKSKTMVPIIIMILFSVFGIVFASLPVCCKICTKGCTPVILGFIAFFFGLLCIIMPHIVLSKGCDEEQKMCNDWCRDKIVGMFYKDSYGAVTILFGLPAIAMGISAMMSPLCHKDVPSAAVVPTGVPNAVVVGGNETALENARLAQQLAEAKESLAKKDLEADRAKFEAQKLAFEMQKKDHMNQSKELLAENERLQKEHSRLAGQYATLEEDVLRGKITATEAEELRKSKAENEAEIAKLQKEIHADSENTKKSNMSQIEQAKAKQQAKLAKKRDAQKKKMEQKQKKETSGNSEDQGS